MIPKTLSAITEADLLSLIQNGVAERKENPYF